MYLKRLDLQGFKSFAARTSFQFGQGITAIVGPNGSGKSNIADALRWVLGEQSSRLLRAKKLDDIIYAGSGKRARSDRVEVTMTLDNSQGWLPLDVSEVTISRKGTRSADSDYLINGRKTRLRELQVLMMKATASQSSYAIIGQGLVESVLNLRPDERRELIEEAADIQRYRLKIEEAQDRLKSTHENVERVKLLMKEIAPRLAQLERQARRAGDHARLSKELMQALQAYYEHQWHRLQESLAVSRAGHDQSQAEFIQAKVGLETCQRELADVSAQLEEQRRTAAAAMAERDRLERRVSDLDRSLLVARERGAILQTRAAELGEELTATEAEQKRINGLITGEDDNRARLQRAVAEAKAVLDGRRQELQEIEQEFREGQTHAADAEAKGRRLEAAAEEQKNRARRTAEARKETAREASRGETRRRSLVNQMSEQLRLLRGQRAQEAQIVDEVSGTAARRREMEAEVSRLRDQLASMEAVQNERRARLEGLQARLAVLEDAQKQADATHPENAVSIEGALSSVYEIIRVPRGLEDAISAALADHLEAFVFDRRTDAVSAIQSLVEQRGPRTVAVPLDTMKQVYPLNLIREKGVLGVASKLVKCQPRFEKVVNLLLGRVIVVQDAATATRLARRGLGTVVTLDGIVFHTAGQISGGQPLASRPFILGYERDLETLPNEMEKIQRSHAITENEVASLRERVRAAEAAAAAVTQEAEQALNKRAGLQDSLGRRQQRLAELKGEMRSLIAEISAVRERDRAALAEIERLGEEREQMLAEAKECFQTARYVERAGSMISERRQSLLGAAEEAAEALAGVDAEYRSLNAQRQANEAALARLQSQGAARGSQLQAAEKELAALRSGAQGQERQLQEAQEELEAFIESRAPAGQGTHHLEARQRDLHNQVLSAQSRMFDAERHVLESEAEVRRWETEVENLRLRMTEDGMTLSAKGEVLSPEAVQIAIPFWLSAESQEDGPGGLRPITGGALIDPEALHKEIEGLRAQIRSLGPVNIEALGDYESMRERHDFLAGQVADLEGAEESLHRAIGELTRLMRTRFETTFTQVAEGFEQNFHAFFGEGGQARLSLSDPKDIDTTGVEIMARPPGKRTHSLNQLSGGEKALTAVSLLFALLQANPSPFCVLDEVDAMLDEVNVVRFAKALKDLSRRTQFIVITHNRRTIETADSIYGVSMAPDAASRVLSMRLAEVTADPSVNLN
ncbi:MAG: chromosome segregation protein SMC [Chloroflexi bacterium]|nr:MAG: chromosome segregation protein SMC [Chloroflexota bacterium]